MDRETFWEAKKNPRAPVGSRGRNDWMMGPSTRFAGPANGLDAPSAVYFSDYQKK
jgi:hypothetical protein